MGFFDPPNRGPGVGPRPNEDDVWGNIGKFFGGVGGAIGDSFQRMTPGFAKQHSAVYHGNQEAAHPAPSVDHSMVRETADGGPVPHAPYTFSGNAGRGGHDDIPVSDYRDGVAPTPKSPLEIIMDQLNQTYHGPDPSKMDFSSLDKALSGRLGYINDAEKQIQGNFDKSDLAVQLMHDAFKHEVQTKDAARFNQISDTQESGLKHNLQDSTNNLAGQRDHYMAEKMAMLKNLGQGAMAAGADKNEQSLNDGIATATKRNGIDMGIAEQGRATNQAYNVGVAQSIGQAGVQRRSELTRQLQGLLGKAEMAKSEARAQDQTSRQTAISQANDTGYKQWNDNQDRLQHMFDTLTNEGIQRDKMAQGSAVNPSAPKGMNYIADQLGQSGMDPNKASQGIAALQDVLSSGNYLEGANGSGSQAGQVPYDKTNIIIQKLRQRGVDPDVATAVGTLYGQM